jgi:hypothetical protein
MKKFNLLSRAEMKKVMGGLESLESAPDICVMKVTGSDGVTRTDTYSTSDANALCVHWIESGQVARCQYDCSKDGWGV